MDTVRPEEVHMKIRRIVRIGEPIREILDAIERERADVVVIGSHGLSSPVGAALGGVARAVLREAAVPVLVVGPLGR